MSRKDDKDMKYKTRNDIILVCILAVLASIIFLFLPKEKGETLLIYKDGILITTLNLNSDAKYDMEILEVIIENGKAYVTNAACPDKVCENTAPIKNKGESIICVPQKIVLKIAGNEFDAVI